MLEDALGGLPLRVWVLQGWDILRFASLLLCVSPPPLSVHGIDANQSWFILGVKRKTAPRPVLRMLHQSLPYRIRMHIVQLLFLFLVTPHVEIIESALPEARRFVCVH